MKKINLSIVTPEGQTFEKEVDSVNMPGTEGRFEVLAKHSNFISTLYTGIVDVMDSKEHLQFIVMEGLVEVGEQGCSILAEKAIAKSDIKIDAFTEQLSALNSKTEKSITDLKQITFIEKALSVL